ncbi:MULTISPECIES: Hint domain-containing protein [unclassified Pseudomonas]
MDGERQREMEEFGRKTQLQALEEGGTREQYNAAMASYFSGIDPRELTTVYPPSMDPGFLAREAGIRVGNDAVALPGEAVRAAESIWKAVSSPLDTIGAIAGGIGGLALGFKDWITSPIPSHTLEKQFDKVATASAQELGGMAFDAATGLITAYIGGRAVEWVGEKWVSAKGTAGTPVTKGPCCFAAGTKVSTPQGDRVIESLKVGDVVWSKPEKGGKPFAAAILATHQRSDQPIYRLKLKSVRGAGAAEGETLLVTPSHPFYVPAKHDFIPVKDLEPGDLLQSLADGDTENTSSEVESLELYLPEGKTYNLTVDVGHTFYVGELKTWVHNTGPCDLPPDYFAGGAKGSSGAESAINQGRLNSQLLAEEVASGHAFQKHVVERQEFADLGISTKNQFQNFVENIVSNPAIDRRQSVDGTMYYLDSSTKTIVIRGQRGEATAFRPDQGGVGWDNYIKSQVPKR